MSQTSGSIGFSALVIFIIVSSFAAPVRAEEKKLYVGLGLFSQNMGRLSNSDTGARSFFTTNYTTLTGLWREPLDASTWFLPAISLTPLGRKSPDGGSRTRLLSLSAAVEKNWNMFVFHGGPGLLVQYASGSGGTITQKNGEDTAVFGLPSTSGTARMFFLTFGAGANFGLVRVDTDLFLSGVLSSRRAVSWLTSVTFGVI